MKLENLFSRLADALSERQLQDSAGILQTQDENLDFAYVEHWVQRFSLQEQWVRARSIAKESDPH